MTKTNDKTHDEKERPKSDQEIIDYNKVYKGLVNVVVDESNISLIDGYAGKLYYRGYAISSLIEKSSFEEVAYLLLFNKLPNQFELEFFKEKLASEREIPDKILMILQSFPRKTTRIELLRTAISALSLYDQDDYEYSKAANVRKGIRIIGRIPTILAYSHRIKGNMPLVPPKKELSHAANFYYMMTGKKPTQKVEKAFDTILMLQAEHALNASTFSARVTASTLSDIYSAVVSAIGTLRGPLHGGANERVINYLLYEVKTKDNVIPWLEMKFSKNEKIMGFGHRVYKTIDPRAKILKKISKGFWEEIMQTNPNDENLHEIGEAIEKYMEEEKGIRPNVDFYSAIVLHALGIPTLLFTPLFAASRAIGWVTHAIEQLENNKLIRPRLRYTGELDREYIPINKRW